MTALERLAVCNNLAVWASPYSDDRRERLRSMPAWQSAQFLRRLSRRIPARTSIRATTGKQQAAQPSVAPAGPAREAALLEGEHPEAYVTEIARLSAGGKIYSTAGGDPAINGLNTFVMSPGAAPDGAPRVFQIGDFNSWRLVQDRGRDAVLEVSRSWIDDGGDVRTATELLIVSVPNDQSTSVTITPARWKLIGL